MSITAKRNSGKSVLMKDLCSQIKDWYSTIYVFSMSARLQPDLFDYVKKENIIDDFNEEKLLEIWKAQEAMVMKMKKADVSPDKIPKVLILFDDIIGSDKVRNSQVLNNFFILGRHLHFAVMIITQEMGGKAGLPKVVRSNLDVAISFFLNSDYDRTIFTDQYLSTKSKKIGQLIFDKVCHTEYQAIVILNFKTDPEPTGYINIFTARLKVPSFFMGENSLDSIARYAKPDTKEIFLKVRSREKKSISFINVGL